jgi:YHS domain-containing protein
MKGLMVFSMVVMLGGAVMPAAMAVEEALVQVPNKYCPVDHKPVSGDHSAVFEGKSYQLCSGRCEGKFNKDPKTYAAKIILPAEGGEPGVNAESMQAAEGFAESE